MGAYVLVNVVGASRQRARSPCRPRSVQAHEHQTSHIVVFGPNNFHLCSCLRLLRVGLLYRHFFFAALLRFIAGEYWGTSLGHDFHGSSMHNRWRRSPDGDDKSRSVSSVLQQAGLAGSWDGWDEELDDNYGGPTFNVDYGG